MERNSLNSRLSSVYSKVDRLTLTLKSATIGVCSSVDRFWKLSFDINLNGEINGESFSKIKEVYPVLSNLTIDQFRRYLKKINQIRNINAHLNKNRSITIDRDLEEYFKSYFEPQYNVSVNSELTVFGQFYILSFIINKHDVMNFITGYFQKKYFIELERMSSDNRTDFRTDLNRKVVKICGIAKPIYNKTNYESLYMNNMFRKNLTNIIFEIERVSIKQNKSSNYSDNLKDQLSLVKCFQTNKEVLNLVCFLRNRWFHGSILGDIVLFDEEDICFNYEFVINAFIRIKECISQDKENFKSVINALNSFAQSCLNFFVLRIIEVTYKLLDKRLVNEEKFLERIQNLNKSFDRFINSDFKFYLLAEKLLEPKDMEFYLNGKKFTDGMERITKCNKLKFITLSSDNGFDIGPFHIDQSKISFVNIDLDEENQHKINNRYLKDYISDAGQKIGCIFSISQASI